VPSAPLPPGTIDVVPRPLTQEEAAIADDALAPGNPDEMLVELNNVPVKRRDMATLRPREWLNDEVINVFMEVLKAREQADKSLPRIHFCSSLFYTKLAESADGYLYKNVKRWTTEKKVHGGIFKKEMVVVPIHCHGNHWTLAVINLRLQRFEYYDSLRGPPGDVLINLRQWLQDESKDKKQAPLDLSGWSDVVYKQHTPQQRNGFDCGVFMCRTADYLGRAARLSFTQDEMLYMRRRMVVEIMREAALTGDH